MRSSVRIVGFILIILFVLASCELMAYLYSSRIALKKGIPFYLPHITESYEAYQARLNPVTGWPSPDGVRNRNDFFDSSGSRHIPAFPDPGKYDAYVSLYGDSFTEAVGVDHEHAWSNILSQLLHCRVANFGVAGFGTDQAYLRFLNNHQDAGKVVILGVVTENIQRNVNQFRNLLSPSSYCLTKPRFLLADQGHLTLVPMPAFSTKDFDVVPHHPQHFFPYDFFVPGGPSGFQQVQFPFFWGIIKASGLLFNRLVLRLQPYMELYQPAHPSQALEVTVSLIEAFCRTSRERGKRPVVLLIPTIADVVRFTRLNTWVYQPILSLLQDRHLEVVDLGPIIIHHLKGANSKTIYDPHIQYHFNEAGNRLLAHTVFDYLTAKNLLPPQATAPKN